MCVIPKFSACWGEHCGAGPGQRLKDCEAGQTQQKPQWDALTTFNSRTGWCFSINSHIKRQELRANTLIFVLWFSNGKEWSREMISRLSH